MSATVNRTVHVKDKVVIKDRAVAKYRSQYPNADLETAFTVVGQDKATGRRRLYVDRLPNLVWVGDVKLAWGAGSKERIKALGW